MIEVLTTLSVQLISTHGLGPQRYAPYIAAHAALRDISSDPARCVAAQHIRLARALVASSYAAIRTELLAPDHNRQCQRLY